MVDAVAIEGQDVVGLWRAARSALTYGNGGMLAGRTVARVRGGARGCVRARA